MGFPNGADLVKSYQKVWDSEGSLSSKSDIQLIGVLDT